VVSFTYHPAFQISCGELYVLSGGMVVSRTSTTVPFLFFKITMLASDPIRANSFVTIALIILAIAVAS